MHTDELAALDTANIISGPRTRGKKIDFRKASEEAGGDDEDVSDRLFSSHAWCDLLPGGVTGHCNLKHLHFYQD